MTKKTKNLRFSATFRKTELIEFYEKGTLGEIAGGWHKYYHYYPQATRTMHGIPFHHNQISSTAIAGPSHQTPNLSERNIVATGLHSTATSICP